MIAQFATKAKHEFTLPGVTLSQNELDGKHWTVKHRQRDLWRWAVMGLHNPPKFNGKPPKADVKIVRVSPRLIDPLNVPAGCKWLLDGFVSQGWLRGDGYHDITISTDQRKCVKGEEPHMELRIEYN